MNSTLAQFRFVASHHSSWCANFRDYKVPRRTSARESHILHSTCSSPRYTAASSHPTGAQEISPGRNNLFRHSINMLCPQQRGPHRLLTSGKVDTNQHALHMHCRLRQQKCKLPACWECSSPRERLQCGAVSSRPRVVCGCHNPTVFTQ